MRIDADTLMAAVARVLHAAGSDGDEPQLVATALVESNLSGHDSHGVVLLPRYVRAMRDGGLRTNRTVRVERDSGAVLVLDGEFGFGQSVGRQAMTLGIARAREHGVCVVALRHSFHLGRIGAFGLQCAHAGLVSMHHVNVVSERCRVAPFGGSDGRFGTNPVCYAFPATDDEPPVLLDMATSAIASGKVLVAMQRGEAVPEGCLVDHLGRPATDPRSLWHPPQGSLLPFGGHKGYGLALVCELLAGALAGGGTARPGHMRPDGEIVNAMLSVLLDPASFGGADALRAEVAAKLADVRQSPPAVPGCPVLLPGEPERIARAQRLHDGIHIEAATWAELLQTAASVGVDLHD